MTVYIEHTKVEEEKKNPPRISQYSKNIRLIDKSPLLSYIPKMDNCNLKFKNNTIYISTPKLNSQV